MINDGENGVVSIGFGKADNEVHSYLLERKGGRICWDFIHCWTSVVCDDLVLLARRAALDIFCNPCAHVWPPVISLGLGDRLVAARMPSYETFVHDSHDFPLDRE